MEPTPAQNFRKPASDTTSHVDGKVLEPVKTIKCSPVDGQPLVTLRQVWEALGYQGSVVCTNKTALVDMSIATLAIQPDQAQIVRKGRKVQIINL